MTLSRPAGEFQGDRAGGPVPYWSDDRITLHLGDCLDVMREMPDACVDSVVTDPPAAIGFMGKSWDGDRGGRDRWIAWLAERMAEACRVLKPGGHALVWSLPRTSGWTQMALEDAGFEVRDCIVHIFGSGYPKSLDVAKAIDKAARGVPQGGADPTSPNHGQYRTQATEGKLWDGDSGQGYGAGGSRFLASTASGRTTAPGTRDTQGQDAAAAVPVLASTPDATATEEAARWHGFGTALKPGQEMWWLVRKPLSSTVASTVLEHGTGALNIAACRVGSEERTNNAGGSSSLQRVSRVESGYRPTVTTSEGVASDVAGRWPANIVLTHSAACEVIGTRVIRGDPRSGQDRGERPGGFGDVGADGGTEKPNGTLHGDQVADVFACAPDCPVAELDRQGGVRAAGGAITGHEPSRRLGAGGIYGDAGSSRPEFAGYGDRGGASRFFHAFRYQAKAPASERPRGDDDSAHVTVKSLGLMKFLVTLVTPPGGTVLDPFCGSGASGEAAVIEGFRCVLIDEDPKSVRLTRVRLSKPIQPTLMGFSA